jgi:phosphoribosylaminoimidazole-succinocarboxamide synthase
MDAMTWGFVGTVVGATASIATTAITNWNTFIISQNSKVQDREERARVFQRETLLDLQVVIRNYLKASVLAHRADKKNYTESGEWGKYALPDELNDQLLELNSKTSILIQRVSNDELRNQLSELKAAVTKNQLARNENDAEMFYAEFMKLDEKVSEKLGKVLRDSY